MAEHQDEEVFWPALRALHAWLVKSEPLAAALRDSLSGSRLSAEGRARTASLVHDIARKRSWLQHGIRCAGIDTAAAGAEWIPLLLFAQHLLEAGWAGDVVSVAGRFASRAHLPASDSSRLISRLLPAGSGAPIASLPDGVAGTALRTSMPRWIVESLVSERGEAMARSVISYLNEAPPVYLRAYAPGDEAARALSGEGIAAAPTGRVDGALRVAKGEIRGTDALATGQVAVQDEGSQLVALLAAPEGGGRVLDCCAGSGGKSLALASLPGSKVDAYDSDPRKLDSLRNRAGRAGLEIRVLDHQPRDAYDSVLVDAPCSGLGAVRRNPEARWSASAEGVARHAAEQAAILEAAAERVKPGGLLVYTVCTFLRKEGAEIAAGFLARRREFLPAACPAWAERYLAPDGPGWLTFPRLWGADVFFVARMERGDRSRLLA